MKAKAGDHGVAFVDEDKSAVSKALAQKLSDHASVRLVQTQAEGQPHDRDSAIQSVRRGDLTAYLLVHPGFGESLRPFGQDGAKIELGVGALRDLATGENGNAEHLGVAVDTERGEVELAWRLLPQRFVAVTGTNGKTTTAELLGAIWRDPVAPHLRPGEQATTDEIVPILAFYHLFGNIDSTFDEIGEGSSEVSWNRRSMNCQAACARYSCFETLKG